MELLLWFVIWSEEQTPQKVIYTWCPNKDMTNMSLEGAFAAKAEASEGGDQFLCGSPPLYGLW